MNWTNAQHYCRVKYTDLATFDNMDDTNRLNRPSLETSLAWIGLTDDPKSWRGTWSNDSISWRWSATGETGRTGYQNWSPGYPNSAKANQFCVFVFNGKWDDYTNPPGQKIYTLIQNSMNWKDAQAYCRTHHTDLAMIENDQENGQVMSLLPNSKRWIGLY
uniref:C-type lectin domain-containing protein n=1 Tax=Stegastes partitus TaxID=144197 RepID=A0A3B4ZVH9_9TELE